VRDPDWVGTILPGGSWGRWRREGAIGHVHLQPADEEALDEELLQRRRLGAGQLRAQLLELDLDRLAVGVLVARVAGDELPLSGRGQVARGRQDRSGGGIFQKLAQDRQCS